ncbi:MAG: nitroreductase family protein [Nanoarchaeota archaeon]
MDFDKVVEKRRSIRSFKDKTVSWKLVLEAIDSALQVPCAGNDLPMNFIVVEDPEKIERLAKASDQLWMNEAPILVAVVSDDSQLESQYGDRGRVYSRQQAGASIQTLLLKLTDLELSACWVGSYDDYDVRFILEIPDNVQIEALIPIGYQSSSAKNDTKPRKKKLDSILRWESFKIKRRQPMFQERKGIVNKDSLPNA